MVLARAACLIGAGVVLGVAVNAARADGVRFSSLAAPTSCAAGAAVAPVPAGGAAMAVEVLPPAEAASLCADPRALLADVRPAADFAQGHVSGAIHLPCAASGSVARAAVELLAGRHTLIVYGHDTSDATPVAEEMRRRAGRADLRVVVIEGGFARWSEAGLACSSGPCAECAARHE